MLFALSIDPFLFKFDAEIEQVHCGAVRASADDIGALIVSTQQPRCHEAYIRRHRGCGRPEDEAA